MKEKLLHTPEGVRDIYNSECKRKSAVEKRIHHILELYGYQDIETPTFEFFDIFNSDTGTVSSVEMFKFFDRNNNTLVLRPDMTPSIARSVAKYYSACEFPLRLSYRGNTFLNNRSYQGKLTEKTEMGAELINDDSPEADAEGIIMMIDCFLAAGLTDFRIDIGQAEFYKGIMDALEASEEVKEQIHEYIENKNALGMEILLSDLSMKDCYRNILLEYNDLYGDVTMLEKAKKQLKDEKTAYNENIEIGVMIETPAAVMISGELAREVDFFSIGTNDLLQLTLGMDRENPKLDKYYNPYHPALMKMIRIVANNVHLEGKRISICGDLAADLSMTEFFVQIGIDELSVAPHQVLGLRKKIREIQ